jgi:hypothetical protein
MLARNRTRAAASSTSENLHTTGQRARARKGHSEAERFGVLHFLATLYLRPKSIKPQFPNGIVRSVSFVSTMSTARSLAGCVLLALALTPWRSPGSSEKLCPAL